MIPKSLTELCLEAGCQYEYSYSDLPFDLKNRLLRKLTKRGQCSNESLQSLIHTHLNTLDLRECSISEESLLCLERLNKIRSLHLPQPPSVNSDAYSEAALVKVVKGKWHLQSLGLSGLQGVSDRVIWVLVGGSPNLMELHLQETPISNRALYCLADLASLRCLNIAKTQVNDNGVKLLAFGSAGRSLVELRLDGCIRLTINSIEVLSLKMRHLNILYCHCCPNLDSSPFLNEISKRQIKQLTWTVY